MEAGINEFMLRLSELLRNCHTSTNSSPCPCLSRPVPSKLVNSREHKREKEERDGTPRASNTNYYYYNYSITDLHERMMIMIIIRELS